MISRHFMSNGRCAAMSGRIRTPNADQSIDPAV
jgi:hypothetical protein